MQITVSPTAWAPKPTETAVGSLCYKKPQTETKLLINDFVTCSK